MMLINNSTRYWTFSLLEEFKVRYEQGVWTVCILYILPRVR